MRHFRYFSVAALLLGLTLAVSAPSASGASKSTGSTTYSGVFSGPVGYVGCSTHQSNHNLAGGTWTVTTHGQSAKGSFTITVNGEPHVSYVANMQLVYSAAPVYFVAFVQTLAGPETVTLYTSGDLTYVIAPYNLDSISCQSVTYTGSGGPVR